jgi:nucleoside-diphosphate-sugar epimerase
MGVWRILAARLGRGFSLKTIGPNEARVYFDFAVCLVGLAMALTFLAVFIPAARFDFGRDWVLGLLPVLLVLINAGFGVYSRLRSASGERKAIVLLAAIICTALIVGAFAAHRDVVTLWAMLVVAPIVLSRWLLNIRTSKRKNLIAVAVADDRSVLVIGGAGYIGSHTVELLLRKGMRVRVLDRLMYGEDSLSDFASNPLFDFVHGDASDISKLTFAMRGVGSVVHLAGLVGDPACAVDESFTRHTNINVTRMVREIAQSMGVRRFVFASSCSVYGVSDTEVGELAPLSPVSLYAQTKIDSENELLRNASDDFVVTVLRFATVFGHSRRQRFDLVANLFTAQAVSDGIITVIGGDQWRPFIHVRDLARAIGIVLGADSLITQNQIFNVGDRKLNLTILQLAEIVKATVQPYRDVRITLTENPEDRRNYAVSFDKIRTMLGFEAQTSIEEGVLEIAESLLAGDVLQYKQEEFSNLAMTRKALARFQDPDELSRIYAPLNAG